MFQRFLFNSLPFFFGVYDYNKDPNKQGTLERFLGIFSDELNSYKGEVDGLASIFDPRTCPSSHLSFTSGYQGFPPETFFVEELFRKNLESHPAIRLGRGRIETARNYFKTLGADLDLTELPNQGPSLYDNDQEYDNNYKWDQGCSLCRYYDVDILDPLNNLPMLSQDLIPAWVIENLLRIWEYLLPINCYITNIYYNGALILDPAIVIRKYSSNNDHIRINAPNIIRKVR